jgi:1,4-dihydroxy-2-naphthoyl-CoA hydrolase
MSIWFQSHPIELINKGNENTMVSNCGIKITEITDRTLIGTMPADDRNKQPFGIVHGGANCVLAESLGSIAANLTCNPKEAHAVGLSITTNHIKAVRNGSVRGVASPTHIGRTTQVWNIETFNDADQLTSTTNLTMAIVKKLK